jgi:hypothetical protein
VAGTTSPAAAAAAAVSAAAAAAAASDINPECLAPLPPVAPRISPKPWPGALGRAIKAEAEVAALQLQVKNLSQQLIAVLIDDDEEQQQPWAGYPPITVQASASLYDDQVQKVSYEQLQVISSSCVDVG